MFGISINPVVGQCMAPVLKPGSYVVFHRFFLQKSIKVGDLVKVKHPKLGILVKNIAHIDSNGLFWLRGANPNGISTLDMGPIRVRHIIGKSLYVYRPTENHKVGAIPQ